MSVVLAVANAAEGATAEGGHLSPYVFGAVGLGVLLLLLFVTWMINVDR
jgi:hypothetical protein